jgi:hypothetical protein
MFELYLVIKQIIINIYNNLFIFNKTNGQTQTKKSITAIKKHKEYHLTE